MRYLPRELRSSLFANSFFARRSSPSRRGKAEGEKLTRPTFFAFSRRVAPRASVDFSRVGATVDFVKNGLVPRPALRKAKLRPGLTYYRPFRAVLGIFLVMDFDTELDSLAEDAKN